MRQWWGFGYRLRALDFAGTQATGADVYGLGATLNDCFYAANIRLPGSVGLTVRVRNVMTEHNSLSAKVTFCHELTPPKLTTFLKRIRKTDISQIDKVHYNTLKSKLQYLFEIIFSLSFS